MGACVHASDRLKEKEKKRKKERKRRGDAPKTESSAYVMPMSASSLCLWSAVIGSSSAVGGASMMSVREVKPSCSGDAAHKRKRRRSVLEIPPMGLMSALEWSATKNATGDTWKASDEEGDTKPKTQTTNNQ